MVNMNCIINIDCLFVESSALTGESIEEIFNKMTQTLIYKIDSGEIPEELVMANKQPKQITNSNFEENSANKNAGGCQC